MKNLSISTFLIVLFLSTTVLTSCQREMFGSIRGEGKLVEQSISLNKITGVELQIPADVYITKGDKQEISIEGQQNIINNINAFVNNEVLTLEFARKVKHSKNITVNIIVDELTYLAIMSSGTITTKSNFTTNHQLNLLIEGSGDILATIDALQVNADIAGSGNIGLSTNTENINCDIIGAGNLKLRGKCNNKTDISIAGSGRFEGFNLETKKCKSVIAGSGNIELYSTETLDIEILGSGNVYYKGNPQLKLDIAGSGNVEKVD